MILGHSVFAAEDAASLDANHQASSYDEAGEPAIALPLAERVRTGRDPRGYQRHHSRILPVVLCGFLDCHSVHRPAGHTSTRGKRVLTLASRPVELDAAVDGSEKQAGRLRDRRRAIRLLGKIHVRLADATKNDVLSRIMRDPVAQTSRFIGLFGTSRVSMCQEHEHADTLAALRRRDGGGAARLIRSHLVHIEADLDLTAGGRSEPDIANILGSQS